MFKRPKSPLQPIPATLAELYRAVRVAPIRTPLDRLSTLSIVFGGCMVVVIVACGAAGQVFPFAKPLLKHVALGSFGLALLAFIACIVLILTDSVFSVTTYFPERFHQSHMTSVELAAGIAARYPKETIQGCLHSVRLEMKIKTRAPVQLQVKVGGLATLFTTAARYFFSLAGAGKAPEHAGASTTTSASLPGSGVFTAVSEFLPAVTWIVLPAVVGFVFAGVVSRTITHRAQERLMRMESVLEKAEILVGGGSPPVARAA